MDEIIKVTWFKETEERAAAWLAAHQGFCARYPLLSVPRVWADLVGTDKRLDTILGAKAQGGGE